MHAFDACGEPQGVPSSGRMSPASHWILGVCVLLFSLAASQSARAQGVAIEHEPVACVIADRFPQLSASVRPAAGVARARVVFRAAGTPNWYFVEMSRE